VEKGSGKISSCVLPTKEPLFNNLLLLFIFQLSVEDFSWQDEAGEGAFPNLENVSSESDGLTYLPFVHAPLRAFHHHLPMQGQNWYNVKLGPSGLLSDVALNETLLFLNLDDATSDEDRPDLLKRHGELFVLPSDLVNEFRLCHFCMYSFLVLST
jgi:hypothetical protein